MKSWIPYGFLLSTVVSKAQIVPLHAFSQYALTSLQPTYAPYNHLDKLDVFERDNNNDRIKFGKLYFNASNRGNKSSILESNTITLDYMFNPEYKSSRGALGGLKVGGGVLHNAFDDLRLTNYFGHVSYIYKLRERSGTSADNWGFGVGFWGRFVSQSLNIEKSIYKDPDDPQIQRVEGMAQKPFAGFGFSLTALHVKQGYIGVGYSWINDENQYSTLSSTGNIEAFKEWNFIGQWAWGGRARRVPNARSVNVRGLLSHHNITLVARTPSLNRQTMRPFYQLNYRVSMSDNFWLGAGWNSASRAQLQAGIILIPKTYETRFMEKHISLAFDFKPQLFAAPVERQFIAMELNFGFFL
jgi:hypothetical protein